MKPFTFKSTDLESISYGKPLNQDENFLGLSLSCTILFPGLSFISFDLFVLILFSGMNEGMNVLARY